MKRALAPQRKSYFVAPLRVTFHVFLALLWFTRSVSALPFERWDHVGPVDYGWGNNAFWTGYEGGCRLRNGYLSTELTTCFKFPNPQAVVNELDTIFNKQNPTRTHIEELLERLADDAIPVPNLTLNYECEKSTTTLITRYDNGQLTSVLDARLRHGVWTADIRYQYNDGPHSGTLHTETDILALLRQRRFYNLENAFDTFKVTTNSRFAACSPEGTYFNLDAARLTCGKDQTTLTVDYRDENGVCADVRTKFLTMPLHLKLSDNGDFSGSCSYTYSLPSFCLPSRTDVSLGCGYEWTKNFPHGDWKDQLNLQLNACREVGKVYFGCNATASPLEDAPTWDINFTFSNFK